MSEYQIDTDESGKRAYIPIGAGWEIQTKGGGSTFRIAKGVEGGERFAILDERAHEPLETMAREVNAVLVALVAERDALRDKLAEYSIP